MGISQRYVTLVAAAALALTGCGDSSGEEAPRCEQAFAAADKDQELQDTDTYLGPAFTACSTLKEFEEASEAHPGVLGNTPSDVYVTSRCRDDDTVAETPLCNSL